MINLCHPISNRYNVAITKVLGKYMEAIIVDTELTARMCIQYLKDHLLDRSSNMVFTSREISYTFDVKNCCYY